MMQLRRAFSNSKDSLKPITGRIDQFNCFHVDESSLDTSSFSNQIGCELVNWKAQFTAVWMSLSIKNSSLIQEACEQHGFKLHHAREDKIVLNQWLKEGDSKLPIYSTHNLGVGGVVLSPCKQKILLVQEQNNRILKDLWKFPGGLVDQGETLQEAVVREIQEETGISATYEGVIGFREQLNFRFGQGDLYFCCLLNAENTEITMQQEELQDAQWVDISLLNERKFYAMAGEVAIHLQAAYSRYGLDKNKFIDLMKSSTLNQRLDIVNGREQHYHLSQILRDTKLI
ncbi:hypothetical protein FGO68_gene4552 [Halteria grandinella]|uniref:Nudix hydrolase domain-containing protein n=1 Tax=Halteria grandinella TaxID=5974 RepID=A0A8J8NLN4_HALGN|nr:hypothetical protein FGO68_gene4552 [Halteria grandinella]